MADALTSAGVPHVLQAAGNMFNVIRHPGVAGEAAVPRAHRVHRAATHPTGKVMKRELSGPV